MLKNIIFVDSDNIDESYAPIIIKEAREFGEIYEAHCFGDFVKKNQSWKCAYYECNMQLHFIPGTKRSGDKPDPNTSDIALTILAMQKLNELSDIDSVIIVSNDKDYIPLAKEIREKFHKQAILFYTQKGNKAIDSYNQSVLLEHEVNNQKEKSEIKKDSLDADLVEAVLEFLNKELENGKTQVLLSSLGTAIKDVKPKKNFAKKMQEIFANSNQLNACYDLILDGKDRVVRK